MESRLSLKIFAIVLSIPLAAMIFGGCSDRSADGADNSKSITQTL